MAYLKELFGDCDSAGCDKPFRYELYKNDGSLDGQYCKTCGYRRMAILEKIEQRSEILKQNAQVGS